MDIGFLILRDAKLFQKLIQASTNRRLTRLGLPYQSFTALSSRLLNRHVFWQLRRSREFLFHRFKPHFQLFQCSSHLTALP